MSPIEKGVMWIIVIGLLAYGLYVATQGSGPSSFPDDNENGSELQVPAEWVAYTDTAQTFSVSVPPEYVANTEYVAPHDGNITGVAFMVPEEITKGTNLSTDTRIAVEQYIHNDTSTCDANAFLVATSTLTTVTDRGEQYSFAESVGAGAGNRYEEYVYALPESAPCTAVHYYIHSTVVENYPEGTVEAFDRNALMRTFNAIRQTLVVE